jgi:outer membrane protein OmpA-like peptidoglycan-associated protein
MKKVILSEKQIKKLMDNIILNEQDTNNSQPTNQSESEYTMYYIGTKRYVVKDNGGSYQLFTLVNDGNGGNKYKIGEELSTELTFNVLNNRLPDIIQNLRDTGGKSQVRGSSGSIYMSKNDDQLFNDVQQYGDDLNPLKNKKGDVVYKKVQVEFQRITDQNTENSLEEGLNNLQPIMQSAKIPGSLTEGMRVVTLGMSRLNKNVPVLGTLFVMITDDLPERRPLEVLPSREGNKLILNKTAIRQKDRTYIWLRFIGQMFGDGGYPWDPNTGTAIIPKTTPVPKETPKPNQIVVTFEKGLNDAFNFDQITLNDDGNKNLQDLINYAKQNYQGVSANVPVICSSSIDGDPNQKLKNGMTRSDYNMDLSKRRAEAIANMLTTQIGFDALKFTPQGIGETDKFDPGKKWPEVTDKLQTAGNRKLIIQLPKLQKTIQQK